MISDIHLCKYWRLLILIIVPILLLPLVVSVNTKESRCGYVVILLAIYWMTEVTALPVSSLLPVVLLPVLGIMDTKSVSQHYLEDNNMLFVGTMVVAIAAENCNLHQRIALAILMKIGCNPKWLMLGLMLSTACLASCISNIGSTAMMMPILDSIIKEVCDRKSTSEGASDQRIKSTDYSTFSINLSSTTKNGFENHKKPKEQEEENKEDLFRKCLYISVAYAANIGSTATLTGGGPNLVLKFVMENMGNYKVTIDYDNWLMFGLPTSILMLFLSWAVIQIIRFGCCKRPFGNNSKDSNSAIVNKYKELGSITSREILVMISFCTMVILWLFRDPRFIKGWCIFFGEIKPNDATVSILIAVLLLILPYERKSITPVLPWKIAEKKLPWGIVILRGGGFALAASISNSGLSSWIGKQLSYLQLLSHDGALIIVCVLVSFLTEIMSNTAMANIVLPIVNQLAQNLNMSPLKMMLPATMACSFAFMLPVGSPANSIVCAHAKIKTMDLLLPGLVVKFLCVGVTLIGVYSFGHYIFDLTTHPNSTNSSTSNITTIDDIIGMDSSSTMSL